MKKDNHSSLSFELDNLLEIFNEKFKNEKVEVFGFTLTTYNKKALVFKLNNNSYEASFPVIILSRSYDMKMMVYKLYNKVNNMKIIKNDNIIILDYGVYSIDPLRFKWMGGFGNS